MPMVPTTLNDARVGITDTTLRDAHQSLFATRMRTQHMLDVAAYLDKVGFYSMEEWGGATYDTCLLNLREDPWERLRQLRATIVNTPLQMLLRGQNLVGYRPYPDDVVDAFVQKAVETGIDIVRVFDALNDIRNVERAAKAVKRAGAHLQGSICYTISPVHTIDGFVAFAKQLKDIGADSICVKDMAGILAPTAASELVSRLVSDVGLPVQVHSLHAGMASMRAKAIEAGAASWTAPHPRRAGPRSRRPSRWWLPHRHRIIPTSTSAASGQRPILKQIIDETPEYSGLIGPLQVHGRSDLPGYGAVQSPRPVKRWAPRTASRRSCRGASVRQSWAPPLVTP